jgi:hypothetical protein
MCFNPELGRFSPNEHVRKYTVTVGDGIRLECRYPYADIALLFTWNKVKYLSDPHPVPVELNNRIILGVDGTVPIDFIIT